MLCAQFLKSTSNFKLNIGVEDQRYQDFCILEMIQLKDYDNKGLYSVHW